MTVYIPNNVFDFNLEAARGNLPGIMTINKFGRNPAVASGGTEEIWDGSTTYVFPATALMTKLSQTTDQVAMRGATIEVQGLDANWDLVIQTKALDGSLTTTPVVLDTPLIRSFRMKVLANVVGDSPIRLHNDAESQDYAIISAGNNQTLMAIYTVPDGKTAYMTSYYATNNPGTGAPTTLDIGLYGRDNKNDFAAQLKHIKGLSADVNAYGRFQHFFIAYLEFTERTDIFIRATTVAAVANVSAGFDLIIVDNS